MNIHWTGDVDRPEGAIDFDIKNIGANNKIIRRSPNIVGNPVGSFEGPETYLHGQWYEIHTDHKIESVDHKFWANEKTRGTVGVLSGFPSEVSLQMITASRAKALPKGATGFSVLFVNGPNLNLLGTREPEIYGKQTLQDIFKDMGARHPDLHAEIMQSNAEHELVNAIQGARNKFDAIVINAAAYTHTSVAIHDALKNFDDIIIEMHISNPHQREEFRHRSFVSPAAHGLVAGFGARGYELALMGVASKL